MKQICTLVAMAALVSTPAPAMPFATAPTGQALTPEAAPGAKFEPLDPGLPALPEFRAGQASAAALSPDGKTLLVLTSGFNRNFGPDGALRPELSREYVFVYDVTGQHPQKLQVLRINDSFLGLAWAPDGSAFYVSGGVDDDVIGFRRAAGGFAQGPIFKLGHKAGLGIGVQPEAAGVAVSPDGRRLLVANAQNDSVSLIDLATGAVSQLDLRRGAGLAGGTFPRAVVWTSDTAAYVTSERDREIIRLDLAGPAKVAARIKVHGQPVALVFGRRGLLYAALNNTDAIGVIDTASDHLIAGAATAGPAGRFPAGLGGAGSNGLALSADGRRLYVTNGGENAVAVVDLGPGGRRPVVQGLIPTGWYPTAAAVSRDGRRLYVVNGKSPPGPNPGGCRANTSIAHDADNACRANNQYVWQIEKAGLLSLPVPAAPALARLTAQVNANNEEDPAASAERRKTLAFLQSHIHHVIYIVKENRTYDQVLGDLGRGDGDPRLTLFPETIAPNHHRLARAFVDLDAFRDSGESSNTGWNWSTAGRTNDWTEREAPVNYAQRGLQYDQEGDNRNVNVALPTAAARHAARAKSPDDPNLLPGQADVAAPDGDEDDDQNGGHGYLWDAALRAHLSLRNWGFYGDLSRYEAGEPDRIPLEREPWKNKLTVFFPTKAALAKVTDPYFRGFDQAFPDYWRFQEWKREFDRFSARGSAPNLMMMRLCHDHFGDFKEGIDGVNTVETEMADDDYAVGLVIQTVAESRFADDTLVFIVEDDAQDGADHVDAHRSMALIAGPFVRQDAVVSTPYTTVDLLHTLESILKLKPHNLNLARARFMTDVFDPSVTHWSYQAVVPAALRATGLPLPPATTAVAVPPMRSSDYWEKAMAGQDFRSEDRLDTVRFNAALWQGLKGGN
jgi:DNA-binding beta-propeller fold protein YncE